MQLYSVSDLFLSVVPNIAFNILIAVINELQKKLTF